MGDIRWACFPRVAEDPHPRTWLKVQADLQLAPNTIEAYGRALEDYLRFSARVGVEPLAATRAHVAAYVQDLATRPNPRGATLRYLGSGTGLANATLQQRLTAVRLYYDYLLEEGVCTENPVGRGRYTPGKGFGGSRERGLIPRYRKLPWIPSDEQWQTILHAASALSLRDRLMLALQYDGALRREELCSVRVDDIDPAHRLLTVRAETTKGRLRDRLVRFSPATLELYGTYLRERRRLHRGPGPLFLSASRRNAGQPITCWTWSDVIADLARRVGLAHRFTTHTPRHLCLTHLARAGWEIHELAKYAGHRSIQTTLLYIHLSGRELAQRYDQAMVEIRAWADIPSARENR